MKRRERTRQLIELGGLIAKAGLIELTDDDRAVLFGLMLEAAAKLRGDDREQQLRLWRRRGRRAFAAAAMASDNVEGQVSDGGSTSGRLSLEKPQIDGAQFVCGETYSNACKSVDGPISSTKESM